MMESAVAISNTLKQLRGLLTNLMNLVHGIMKSTQSLPKIDKRLAELTNAVNALTKEVEGFRQDQKFYGRFKTDDSPDIGRPQTETIPRTLST